jgi:hypothetical protein
MEQRNLPMSESSVFIRHYSRTPAFARTVPFPLAIQPRLNWLLPRACLIGWLQFPLDVGSRHRLKVVSRIVLSCYLSPFFIFLVEDGTRLVKGRVSCAIHPPHLCITPYLSLSPNDGTRQYRPISKSTITLSPPMTEPVLGPNLKFLSSLSFLKRRIPSS